MKRTMSKSEQTADMQDYNWISRFLTSFLLITVLVLVVLRNPYELHRPESHKFETSRRSKQSRAS